MLSIGLSMEIGSPRLAQQPSATIHSFQQGELPSWITLTRASHATYLDAAGSIVGVADDVPRFEAGPDGSIKGLLTEPASTRVTAHPTSPFSSWGVVSGATIASAPDMALGVFDDAAQVASAGQDWHRLNLPSFAVALGEAVAVTLYYKAGSSGRARVVYRDEAAATESVAHGPVGALTISQSDAGSMAIMSQEMIEDVHVLKFSIIAAAVSAQIFVGIGPDSAASGDDVIVLGGYAEKAAQPTSLILISPASIATRAADTVTAQAPAVGADNGDVLRLRDGANSVTDVPFESGAATFPIATPTIWRTAQHVKAWTPTRLAALTHWFRAKSLDLADGASISQWDDLSGAGRHATQTTASRQPIFDADGLNGGPAIYSDGDDKLLAGVNPIAVGQAMTAWIVYKPDPSTPDPSTGSSVNAFVAFDEATTGASAFAIRQERDNLTEVRTVSYTGGGVIHSGDDAPVLAGLVFDGSRVKTRAYDVEIDDDLASATGIVISGLYILGEPTNQNRSAVGWLSEIVVMTGVATSDQLARVEGYLAHEHGLTASLANDHPYKSERPLL